MGVGLGSLSPGLLGGKGSPDFPGGKGLGLLQGGLERDVLS